MPKTEAQRIEKLQDQIDALEQLLLAHIYAASLSDRDIVLDTLEVARKQSDGALDARRGRVAICLDSLIKTIQQNID